MSVELYIVFPIISDYTLYIQTWTSLDYIQLRKKKWLGLGFNLSSLVWSGL